MTVFHPFPRLPYELRIQVWESTLELRTIKIREIKPRMENGDRNDCYKPQLYNVTSCTPVPAVLHVCREARKHAGGLYQKCFTDIISSQGVEMQYIWVNWDLDMIDIGLAPLDCVRPIASWLQRIRFERSFAWRWFKDNEAPEIDWFPNLKEIYVICAEPGGPIDWAHVFSGTHYWPCGDDNMYFIDKHSGKVFRGPQGIVEIVKLDALKHARGRSHLRGERQKIIRRIG